MIWRKWNDRRKFGSQTSDNMDTWKSRGGKSQRGEAKKWEDRRRERVRRKQMQAREKVGKLRLTVFPMICGCAGSKSRLAKAAGGDIWPDEKWKIAPRCGTFPSQKCTKHTIPGPLLELEMSKKCTPLWHKAHFQVKSKKNSQSRTTFGSEHVEKCTSLSREAHFQVKMYKTHHSRATFGTWDVEKMKSVKKLTVSDHFLKWACRKRARCCRAKHISKWKVSKTGGLELFLMFRCRKSANLTNLTKLTNLTNQTNLTNSTNFTNTTNLTNWTNKQTNLLTQLTN